MDKILDLKTLYIKIKLILIIAGVLLVILAAVGSTFYAAKKLCGIPFIEKVNDEIGAICEYVDQIFGEGYEPFSNKKITELGNEIQKNRNDKITALGGGGIKYLTRKSHLDDENEVNEANIHLRTLMDMDDMVLKGVYEEKDLEDGMYKDTNLEKMWKISKKMQTENKYQTIQEDAKKGDWTFREWIMFAQSKVYQCYFIGNDRGFDWFYQVEKPCDDIDNLYGKAYVKEDVPNGNVTEYGDRSVVDQAKKIITFQKTCVANEQPATEGGTTGEGNNNGGNDGSGDTGSGNKPPDLGKMPQMPFFSLLNLLDQLFNNHVEAKGVDTVIPASPCPPNTTETGETSTSVEELTHVHIYEILEGFKPYSLYEDGTPTIPENENFKKELDNALLLIYNEQLGMTDPSTIIGGNLFNGWMIPLAEGTYFMGSNYGCRRLGSNQDSRCITPENDYHDGVDLGSGAGRALGLPIMAMQGGRVIYANPNNDSPVGKVTNANMDGDVGGYGGLIIIQHSNGWYTSYGHLRRGDILVHPGWEVSQGQIIASVGDNAGDGAKTTPHLHMQICENAAETEILCGMSQFNSYAKDPEAEPLNIKFNKDEKLVNLTKMAEQKKLFESIKEKIRNIKGGTDLEKEVGEITRQFSVREIFGIVSAKYETGGMKGSGYCNTNPSFSDHYCGTWQMTPGSMTKFINKLASTYQEPELANLLKTGTPGTMEFVPIWQQANDLDPNKFLSLQKRYIIEEYYNPVNKNVMEIYGFSIEERSYAFQEMMVSTSVQFGPNSSIIKKPVENLKKEEIKNMSDEQIILKLYEKKRDLACDYFCKGNSAEVVESLRKNRFTQEPCDLVRLVRDENYKNEIESVPKHMACTY